MEHLQSTLQVNLAQYSDRGRKPENQDTVGARVPDARQPALLTTKGIALAIADGVSSSAAARQASQTAVTGFLTDYYATPDTWTTHKSASRVIRSLNHYLWGQSRNSVREGGYLTTLSILILKGDKSFIFHVGDTRVYRLRGTTLELLTRDHTQRMNRRTTYLSRALGADPVLEIDSHADEVQPDDLFVLTSDGIHAAIPAAQFSRLILQHQLDPQHLVQAAVQAALDCASEDNLSIQAVRVNQVGVATQSDTVRVLSQLPFPPLLTAGQIIDELAVKRSLCETERSQVYLVETPDGTPCVMKTPAGKYADDPAYIERFVLESWIGTRIQSPHVARVVPSPHCRSALYYLTEHIAGPTLEQLIRERAPLEISDALTLIEQVIKGVRAFHRKETLHQDIKPANVVVGARGAVVIDFGSCHVAGIHEVGSPIARERALGTMDYSAPEYRCGGRITQRADQFSLAVIFYEMLTGKHPYGTGYANATSLQQFRRLAYIPARRHNPLVPAWLDRAIEKALHLTPSARYEALSEWLRDLKRPNPDWLLPSERPLLERDPLKAWKILAALGWITAAGLLLLQLPA